MSSGHSHSLELLGRHCICHNPPPWKLYCRGPGSAGQLEGTSHRLGSWGAESGPVPGPCSRPRLLLWSLSQDTPRLRGPTRPASRAGAREPKHREEAWQAVVVWNSGCSGQHLLLTHYICEAASWWRYGLNARVGCNWEWLSLYQCPMPQFPLLSNGNENTFSGR